MLGRQRQLRKQMYRLVDAGLFAIAFRLAHLLRSHWQLAILGGTPEIPSFEEFNWLFVVVLLLAPLWLELGGFYSRPLLPSRRSTAWRLFKGCTLAVISVISVMFLLRIQLARSVIILFGGISFALVLVKEELMRWWLQSELGKAQFKQRLILVGSPADNRRLERELKTARAEGIEIPAQMDLNTAPIETLVELLHEHSANGVVLNTQQAYFGQVERAIQICELEGVEVWLLADFFKTQISRTTVDELYGRPMLVFRSTPEASWQAVIKQVVDVMVGFVLLVAFGSLVMWWVALWIRLTSRGPILFRQQRSGLNGKPFVMLKFRSMASDAEQRKHELATLNEMKGPVFKMTNDPRVTAVGRFIRRWSIDELPQLFNVLRGEMSLVGPRPLPVDEVRRFEDLAHRRRLSVKPGLTCLWQVSGRNQVTNFGEWVRLDLEYIDNWSLWLDFKILLRTIPAVFSGAGAK
ncbi:MAG: sugar transferase [Verrucomicrobia bacterium]|nr:sugar transferase [Verrucomicrobiota bacterium]